MLSYRFWEILKKTFFIEPLWAAASDSLSKVMSTDHNKDIKVSSTKAILLTFIVNFENVFCMLSNFENNHPGQNLKISEILKGNIRSGVPL